MTHNIPATRFQGESDAFISLTYALLSYGNISLSDIYVLLKLDNPEELLKKRKIVNTHLSLDKMDKIIRKHLEVKKKEYIKLKNRKALKYFLLNNKSKAIVCCKGYYVYVDGNTYYSFYDNSNEVVSCIWYLK